MAGMNWQVTRWLGDSVECVDTRDGRQTVGLENLYRRARHADRENWPKLIGDFLHVLETSCAEGTAATDLTAVADRVLIRIVPASQGASDAMRKARVWLQPLGRSGLWINLLVDYTDRMVYVSDELIAASGQSSEKWLRRALANLRARTPETWCEVIEEETGIRVSTVGDAYDAARALLLEELLPETVKGWFVAPAGRDLLFFLPVSEVALRWVVLLKGVAEQQFSTTPYPISDQVFWIHQGDWHRFPIDVRGKEATVTPPEEFAALLPGLLGSPENEESDETPPTREDLA